MPTVLGCSCANSSPPSFVPMMPSALSGPCQTSFHFVPAAMTPGIPVTVTSFAGVGCGKGFRCCAAASAPKAKAIANATEHFIGCLPRPMRNLTDDPTGWIAHDPVELRLLRWDAELFGDLSTRRQLHDLPLAHPRCREDLRIGQRHVQLQCVAIEPAIALLQRHLGGVRHSEVIEPAAVIEEPGVEAERAAVPPSGGRAVE